MHNYRNFIFLSSLTQNFFNEESREKIGDPIVDIYLKDKDNGSACRRIRMVSYYTKLPVSHWYAYFFP